MPMTLRVLKKRSKQALDILVRHYGAKVADAYPAEAGVSHHGLRIRCGCTARKGHCHHACHPLKGTPMFGGMDGGQQPEWSEETALERLQGHVTWSDRPASMTDREWARTLRIVGVRAFDRAAFDAEMAALDERVAEAA